MGSFRLLDHTADVQVEARGKDWPDLLSALVGSYHQITTGRSPPGATEAAARTVAFPTFEATTRGLIQAYNELIWIHEREQAIPCRLVPTDDGFQVALTSEADGQGVEVKAATHHMVELAHTDQGWRARITLDL